VSGQLAVVDALDGHGPDAAGLLGIEAGEDGDTLLLHQPPSPALAKIA